MKTHSDTCMCHLCLIKTAAKAAAEMYPGDPQRQAELVNAYCLGLLQSKHVSPELEYKGDTK